MPVCRRLMETGQTQIAVPIFDRPHFACGMVMCCVNSCCHFVAANAAAFDKINKG